MLLPREICRSRFQRITGEKAARRLPRFPQNTCDYKARVVGFATAPSRACTQRRHLAVTAENDIVSRRRLPEAPNILHLRRRNAAT